MKQDYKKSRGSSIVKPHDISINNGNKKISNLFKEGLDKDILESIIQEKRNVLKTLSMGIKIKFANIFLRLMIIKFDELERKKEEHEAIDSKEILINLEQIEINIQEILIRELNKPPYIMKEKSSSKSTDYLILKNEETNEKYRNVNVSLM